MGSVNKAIILGNLGADPEMRFTQGNVPVAKFNVATTEKWKDKSGQLQEKTEWHRVVVWGKMAENIKFLSKGRQVYVEGRIQTRQWEKDGQKKYTTEIVATSVVFLGGPRGERPEQAAPEQPAPDRSQVAPRGVRQNDEPMEFIEHDSPPPESDIPF